MRGPTSKVHIYRIDAPFADILPVTDEQIIQEANPVAVFSHLTALARHGLTDQIPSEIHVNHYKPSDKNRIPLGTTPEDWLGTRPPRLLRPNTVGKVAVRWFLVKGEWDFGHTIHYSEGLPIYVTDMERTLLDALRAPDDAGGIANVLRAWRLSVPQLQTDRLTEYVDRFGQAILRQRVGYLLESLGLSHPRLAAWKRNLVRGSSVRLVAARPFAPTFSAEWNLSLNVPPEILSELRDDADD
ncbi:MAG: hypothetical protein U0746_14600 [Gemmataceae bacterium]